MEFAQFGGGANYHMLDLKHPKNRFLFLDGLRGIAAFIVILEHMPSNPISNLLPSREFGMCFFFLLSGFVMEHAYGAKLQESLSAWQMIKIRIIRLYPLYLVAFLMGASVSLYGVWKGWDPTPVGNVAVVGAFGLLMLPAPPVYSVSLYPFLRPAWSLAFEMLASVIYAFVARILTNRLLAAIVIASGLGFAWTTFLPGRAWGWQGFWYGFSMVIYGFFGGVMIHRWYLAGKLPRLPAWLGVVGLFAALAVPTNDTTEAFYYTFGGVVLAPLFLVCFARTQVRGTFARVCSTLGVLSYGVYVTHVPIRRMLELVISKYHWEHLPNWTILIVVTLLATLLTVVLNRFYDRPVRRWLFARAYKKVSSPRPVIQDDARLPAQAIA